MPIKYYLKLTSITTVLIAANVLIYILSCIFSRDISPNNSVLISLGANYSPNIYLHGETWRFVTSMFLHANLLHLLFNMISLNMIGKGLEQILGKAKFTLLYFISGIGGSIASYLFTAKVIFNTPQMSLSIGASGAIFGLLGFMLSQKLIERSNVLKGRLKRYLNIDFNSVVITVALNLIIGFSVYGIDNSAHLGGLIVGFILGMFI